MIIVDVGFDKGSKTHKSLDTLDDFVAFSNIHQALEEYPDQMVTSIGDLINSAINPLKFLKPDEPIYIFSHGGKGYMANSKMPSVNIASDSILVTNAIHGFQQQGIGNLLAEKLEDAHIHGSRVSIHLACASAHPRRIPPRLPSLVAGTANQLNKKKIFGVKVFGNYGSGFYAELEGLDREYYVGITDLGDIFYEPQDTNEYKDLKNSVATYLRTTKDNCKDKASTIYDKSKNYYDNLLKSNIELCSVFPANQGTICMISQDPSKIFNPPKLDDNQRTIVNNMLKQYYIDLEKVLEHKKITDSLTPVETLTLAGIKKILGSNGPAGIKKSFRDMTFIFKTAPTMTVTRAQCMAEIQKLFTFVYCEVLQFKVENQQCSNESRLRLESFGGTRYITDYLSQLTPKPTNAITVAGQCVTLCEKIIEGEIVIHQDWLDDQISGTPSLPVDWPEDMNRRITVDNETSKTLMTECFANMPAKLKIILNKEILDLLKKAEKDFLVSEKLLFLCRNDVSVSAKIKRHSNKGGTNCARVMALFDEALKLYEREGEGVDENKLKTFVCNIQIAAHVVKCEKLLAQCEADPRNLKNRNYINYRATQYIKTAITLLEKEKLRFNPPSSSVTKVI